MNNPLTNELRACFLKGLLIARYHVKREAPIRSGNLRRASDFSQPKIEGDSFVSFLGFDNSQMKKKYGEYVVFGTGLYGPYKKEIYPKVKKALGYGKLLEVVNGVNHWEFVRRSVKGMKPNNYFKTAYNQNQTKISEAIGEAARLLVVREINITRGRNEQK